MEITLHAGANGGESVTFAEAVEHVRNGRFVSVAAEGAGVRPVTVSPRTRSWRDETIRKPAQVSWASPGAADLGTAEAYASAIQLAAQVARAANL